MLVWCVKLARLYLQIGNDSGFMRITDGDDSYFFELKKLILPNISNQLKILFGKRYTTS